jgi:hypothetical protein
LSAAAITWLIARPDTAAAQGGATLSYGVRVSGFFLLDFSADGVHQVTSFTAAAGETVLTDSPGAEPPP